MKKLVSVLSLSLLVSVTILSAQMSFNSEIELENKIERIVKQCESVEISLGEFVITFSTTQAISNTDKTIKVIVTDEGGNEGTGHTKKAAEGFYFLGNYYYILSPEIPIPDLNDAYEEYKKYLESLEQMEDAGQDGVIIIEMEEQVEPGKNAMTKPEGSLTQMPNFPVDAGGVLKDGRLTDRQFIFMGKVYNNLPEEEIMPTRTPL